MQDQLVMERITKNLPTKSEKIRKLNAAGYSRQAIADFLGIRYQHVRNVLVDDERRRPAGFSEGYRPPAAATPAAPPSSNPGRVSVREDGSIVLPPSILAASGYKAGDTLVARAEGKGVVHLFSGKAAIRRAQELVREFVRENVSLVDELLKERRREAEND